MVDEKKVAYVSAQLMECVAVCRADKLSELEIGAGVGAFLARYCGTVHNVECVATYARSHVRTP